MSDKTNKIATGLVRHAFMSGAGYGDFDRISAADQRRWAAYSPPCLEGNADAVAGTLADALEPFADQAEFWSEQVSDVTPLLEKDGLTVGDVRRAGEALRAYREATKP